MSPDRALQVCVALWLSRLYSLEADDLTYAWPRFEGWELESAALADASDAMYALAARFAGGEITELEYRAALEDFESPGAAP